MTGDMRITAADLSDDAVAAELERRRARLAQADAAPVVTTALLCWRLGGVRFACALGAIRQVVDAVTTTPLPGTPASVIGVFARRGVIHTLFDPADALRVVRGDAGGGDAGGAGAGAVLLIRQGPPHVAIRVDAVEDVVRLPTADVAAADGMAADGGIARPIVPPDGTPITIVDMAGLIGQLTGRKPAAAAEG